MCMRINRLIEKHVVSIKHGQQPVGRILVHSPSQTLKTELAILTVNGETEN